MFAGEKKRLQLVFDNSLIGVAIDRFGKEIPVLKESETQFRTIRKMVSASSFMAGLEELKEVLGMHQNSKEETVAFPVQLGV